MHTIHRDVPVRHPDFSSVLGDLPKRFVAEDDAVGSHLVAVLSAIFPPGEEYFVRAVERVRDRIDDPELAAQVDGFIGQEDMHGDRHRALNVRLDELGYPTEAVDRYVEVVARWADRRLSPMTNLAITAALEHHTAVVAETLLGEPEARALIGDDTVRDLFCWHALEESEHKAVAFDVYRHLGGSERRRVWAIHAMNVLFALEVAVWTLVSVLRDRDTWRHPIHVVRGLRRLAGSPFLSRRMLRRLRAYNRPGFHPDDHDTSDLIARFRAELFSADGRLAEVTPEADWTETAAAS